MEVAPIAQRLIAFLALQGGRPVRRAWISGSLWMDASDARAAASLRSALWRCPTAGERPVVRSTLTHLALDPELRVTTREAVAAALAHEQATVVLVTHDQAEALSFADQVAIVHEGRFTQVGAPADVYRSPSDRRSAISLGEVCFLPGQVRDGVVTCVLGALPARGLNGYSGACDVLIRPEQLRLDETASGACRAEVTTTCRSAGSARSV